MNKTKLTLFSSIACLSLLLGSVDLSGQASCASVTITGVPGTTDSIASDLPDVERTLSLAGIPGNAAIVEISLELGINHTWVGDLEISLESPAGLSQDLMFDADGSCNMCASIPVTLIDGGTPLGSMTCGEGCAEIDGTEVGGGGTEDTYAPMNAMSNFDTGDPTDLNGDWTLTINDDAGGDEGNFISATLNVCYIECSIECPYGSAMAPCADYFLDETVSFNYVDITATGTHILDDGDEVGVLVDLPAPLFLYGEVLTQVGVHMNGFISSSTNVTSDDGDLSNDCPINDNYSTGDDAGNRIIVLHDDFEAATELDATAGIYYQYFASSPYAHPSGEDYGAHVFQWIVDHESPQGTADTEFECIVFDNGDIVYQHLSDNEAGGSSFAPSPTSGIVTGEDSTVPCAPSVTQIFCSTSTATNVFVPGAAYGLSPYGVPLSEVAPPAAGLELGTDADACGATTTFPDLGLDPACEGAITVTYEIIGATTGSGTWTPSTEFFFEPGVSIITFIATDGSGNSTQCAFDVTVVDDTPPTVACPDDIIIDLGPGACNAIVSYNIGVTDNCPLEPTIVEVPEAMATLETSPGAANNGNASGGTVFFDLVNNTAQPLQIVQMTSDIDGASQIDVYTKSGTGFGFEQNAGAWTLASSGNAAGAGVTPFDVYFSIPPGVTGVALHVVSTTSNYVTGTGGAGAYGSTANSSYSDGTIDILAGATSNTFFASAPFNPRLWRGSVSYTSEEAVITVGDLMQTDGLPSGSVFEVGTTTNCFVATDDAGNTGTCCFDVIVNEYSGPVSTSLACNDLVNVSLDADCMAFVGTDMVLEGGPYACYDDYMVAVEGFGSGLGGVEIDGSAAGQTLTATVTDPTTGNSCWGELLIEDKLIDPLVCMDFSAPCGSTIIPGTESSSDAVLFASEDTATLEDVTAVACPGGDYQYLRVIDLDGSSFTPTKFRMGVEISNGGINATLRFYTFNDPNDYTLGQLGFDYADLTQIGPDNMGVIPALDLEFWEMPVSGVTIPAGTKWLVWELQVPGGNFVDFVMGSNTEGETTPTYLASDFCATPNPVTLSSIGFDGNWVSMVFGVLSTEIPFPLPDDVTVVPPSGTGPFTVLGFDPCGPSTLNYVDNETGELCGNQVVERTWTITDPSGNSSQCVQNITITPLDLSGLECPENYIGQCGQSIHPDFTGYPTIDGIEITPGGFCNIFINYTDEEFDDCGAGVKIVRTWKLLDWCEEVTTTCDQIIKLSDEEGPVLECPDNMTVNTDPWFCHTDVNIYPPYAEDACGTPFSLSVSVSAGTLIHFGGDNYRVDDLPIGEHTVTWTAIDDCGNESTCSYTITVEDEVPPVPLCDEHTIVSLTFDDPLDEGLTKIPATTFDDGSYDNCTPVSFEARRVPSCIDFDWTTNGAGIDEIPNNIVDSRDRGQVFREYVPFACCDVAAGPIMVELRVTDDFGNVNTCMVEVEVQDKLPPYIECPPHVEVSCEFWFDAQETNGFVDQSEDVTAHVFGVVLDAYEYDEEDREAIIIDDPGRPTNPNDPDYLPQPYMWGYDGWADDNCDVDITVRVRIFDDCSGEDFPVAAPHPYAVRLVERTFRARDGQGNSSTCIQRIWVIDYEPFYISDQTCVNSDPNDGVIWPCDKEYSTCPDEIPVDYPTIFDDNCSLIGVTYEDQRFDFVDNACYKILRTWAVIDWCQYDVNTGAGYWEHVQIIKVLDHDGAEFLSCPDGPVTLCVADPNVELPANNQVFLGEADPNSTSCSVHVRMEQTVYETCSDWVEYDVKVYPYNGSEYLQVVNKTQVSMDTANEAVLVFDTKTSALLAVRQNGLPYNDRYCLGIGGPKDYHRILWSVEDGCGNLSTCEYLFRLEDCKQPSPVCVGLSSVVMPSSGEVTIWAVDFNASSFDDCTAAADLLYSFSGETYMPSYSFDCDAIEANGSPSFTIEIWVADEGNDHDCNGVITWDERNKDFCTTFIVIDDNEGVCPGGGSAGAVGVVQTEIQEPVEEVTLNLTAAGSIMHTYTTEKDGQFHFFVPILDYTLEAERNDDHKNGVSTLDLVKIQKHLLGIEALNSPYKLIAADANNSETVSAIDLVELRKLILGIYTELPNNQSWRFVDADYEFADATNPWPFSEVINLEPGEMNEDAYVGVKIGDVNETVTANANQVQTRNARGVLSFETAEQSVTAGEEVTVDVHSSNFDGVQGYQFTLRTEGLKLQDVTAGALEMGSENVGIHKSAVTASWHNAQPISVGSDAVLFTLTFVATQSGQLSDMLSMTSQVTEAEAYTSASLSTGSNEEILDAALVIQSDLGSAERAEQYALFQNEPNPFRGETLIGFTLPEAMEATVTVFDVTGKVVHLVEGDFDAGYNEIKLRQKELSSTGVMYYRLDADDFTATKKMVLID